MANNEMFHKDNLRPTQRKENKEIILKKIAEDVKVHEEKIKKIKKEAHNEVLLLYPNGKEVIATEKKHDEEIIKTEKELKKLKENYEQNYLKTTLPIYLYNKQKEELKDKLKEETNTLKKDYERRKRAVVAKTVNRPKREFEKELNELEKNHRIIRKSIKKSPDLGKIAIAEELEYVDEKHQKVVLELTLKYQDDINEVEKTLLTKENIKPELTSLEKEYKENLLLTKTSYKQNISALVAPDKKEIKEEAKSFKVTFKEQAKELKNKIKVLKADKKADVKLVKETLVIKEELKELKQSEKIIKRKAKQEIVREKQEIKKIKGFRPRKLTYNRRKVLFGLIFIAPWLIGFFVLFVYPFVQSFYYSFFELTPSVGTIQTKFVGIDNYIYAFQEHVFGTDSSFKIEILSTLQNSIINLFVLVIFSLFMAVLLNHEFRGRAIIRAIFFIPVILNSSAVSIALSQGSDLTDLLLQESQVSVFDLGSYLMGMGLGTSLIGFVVGLIGRIYDIITLSGVPILLFLAAIQSVPKHLYEAATIEGATGYEQFWLITLPNVSPHIITVSIYAIVDTFLTSSVATIITYEFNKQNWGLSSAMSWIYVGLIIGILLVLGILAKIFKIGESHYEKEK